MSHKSLLALALGLVLLGGIALCVPRQAPVSPLSALPFQARPVTISWDLDDEFANDDEQVIGVLKKLVVPDGDPPPRQPAGNSKPMPGA